MNDRYLFKAKRIDNGEWVRGYYSKNYIGAHFIDVFEVKPETLCQCTGLKDKNGTLIWENDIAKCQDVVGKVGWNETHLAFTILANVNGNMQYYYIDESLGEEIEVIGSIFDNLKLLEARKMGRLIDEEKFKENLIKCKGLGRKSCELVCEVLNNTPTACNVNDVKKYCCTCAWYEFTSGACCNVCSKFFGDNRSLDDSCEEWEEFNDE